MGHPGASGRSLCFKVPPPPQTGRGEQRPTDGPTDGPTDVSLFTRSSQKIMSCIIPLRRSPYQICTFVSQLAIYHNATNHTTSSTDRLHDPNNPTLNPKMEASSATTKPPSLYSKASSTTLVPTSDQTQTTSKEPCHTYYQRMGPPNPEAQPKSKSKLGKLLSKLPSSAVQRSVDMRERQLVEEERTGVRRVIVADGTEVSDCFCSDLLGRRSLGAVMEGKDVR